MSYIPVTCVVPAVWMQHCGVTPEDIRHAAEHATLHLEGRESEAPLDPCAKCCAPLSRPNVCMGRAMAELAPSEHLRSFFFDRCVPNCNSSRLHLGEKVVLVFEIRRADGAVAGRAVSDCIKILSQSGFRRKLGPPPRIKWVDMESRACSTGSDERAERRRALKKSSGSQSDSSSSGAHTPTSAPTAEPLEEAAALGAELETPGPVQQPQVPPEQPTIDEAEAEELRRQLEQLQRLQDEQTARVQLLCSLLRGTNPGQ
eukprot:m51a1_g8398 hypothetical protein (258) ;mRNA; r:227073-228334